MPTAQPPGAPPTLSRSLPLAPPTRDLQVRGYLEQDSTRFERPLLHGHWDDALYADMPNGQQARSGRSRHSTPSCRGRAGR